MNASDDLEQYENYSINSNENFDSKVSSRQYLIKVAENKTLKFNLKFQPKDVKEYQVVLPISLYSYGKLTDLNKQIYCKGIKPKFIMRPQEIDFKKKLVLPQVR